MATLKADLRQILERYDINPTDKSQLWDCHGTLVLYHRAYEIIAAKEGIVFDPPQVIEANGAEKVVAVLVVGRMKDRTEWSFGEALPANCKNAYPYATAEKRAKDRVIAKLVGLAQYVYSEDEADEFKDGLRLAVADGPAAAPPARQTPAAPAHKPAPFDPKVAADNMRDLIDGAKNLTALNFLMSSNGQRPDHADPTEGSRLYKIKVASESAYAFLLDRANKRRGVLSQAPSQAAE